MAKKSLHKQVKYALEQPPERPLEEDMWADMESRLEENREQRRLPVWLIFGLLSVLPFAIFLLLPSDNSSTETIENRIADKLVLKPENEENSIIINSKNSQIKSQAEEIKETTEEKLTTVVEDIAGLNEKILSNPKNESLMKSQVADSEYVKFSMLNFNHEEKDTLPQNNNKYLAHQRMLLSEITPLPSRPFKVTEEESNIEAGVFDMYFDSFYLLKVKKRGIQVGFFTGKTYSYLDFSALGLISEETKSSKTHFGLSTLFNLNQSLKIGFNAHYKKGMYSHFSNWDNIPMTSTHFVSRTESVPQLLGLGLNLTYHPLKNRAISPYFGLGIQQDLKLQDKRTYYFSPSIYSTDLSEYIETNKLKGEVFRNRTTLIKLGTEVRLSSKIQVFGECLRHLPLDKEINISKYNWSWRAGILYNLK